MTPNRLHRTAGAKGRRGSALILVLMLTFALAALAGSAILLSSTATMTVKSRESQHDLRYAADAAVAIGESQIANSPTVVPQTSYSQFATNQPMLAADSSQIGGITYNLWAGLTGEVSRQNGRFITLVAQSIDSAHHKSFVRRVELIQESFAKFAYFSNSENGICFGSGDVLAGPVFSNGTIANCSGQNATFEDSVQAVAGVDSQPPGVYQKSWLAPPRATVASIPMPNTAGLANLFTIAGTGSTAFTSPNSNTDSTSKVRARLEFVAYNDTTPTLAADSVEPGEGFVKFYQIDETNAYWTTNYTAAQRDSAAASYLRSGIRHYADPRNCGDWHFVWDSVPTTHAVSYSYQFFPAVVHDSAWFQTAETNAAASTVHGGKYWWISGDSVYHGFVKDIGTAPFAAGLDSSFVVQYHVPAGAHSWLTSTYLSETSAIGTGNAWKIWLAVITPQRDTNPNYPAPVCYPAGDPHLVAIERYGWNDVLGVPYGHKGGTDTTFTYGNGGGPGNAMPAGKGLGHWSVYPGTVTWANANFTNNHADYKALFPIDTAKNHSFQGVVAVHGTVAVSGNVNGHITVYSDGSVGILDNLRLVTGTTDTLCNHGMGIVAGNDITALDNAINVPQHWTPNDAGNTTVLTNYVTLRPNNAGTAATQGASTFGGSLYVQSTVMALGSWGAEGLNSDTNYVSTVNCSAASPPDVYKRGCLYVFGSIIQALRQTVNSGSGGPGGYGYAKAYTYDICAVQNPLPYFPTTGRLIENKYYEVNPNTFSAAALYNSLQLP
ncbi:MAG TPA: hypothetical protein VFA43_04755 [Gemmatimonadaceae bacterium]|nr:hypothetical protein [Gemmatimonadaceae bacterium]